MEWLPGTGILTLAVVPTGLYALGVTVLALLAARVGVRKRRDSAKGFEGLALLALIGAALAFLAGHFLLRYVALEVIALCVALAPLIASAGSLGDVEGKRSSWAAYLFLRVGDAGLLAAILTLYGAVGTLDIDAALAAGRGLAPARLGWVVAGFVLAVWVKIGLWPFSLWVHTGWQLETAARAWLYLTLMPNLGLYLLYKVTPLLAASISVRTAALWIGAGGAIISMWMALLRRDFDADEIALWSAQGGLILWTAALGLKPVVWVSLILWTPLRLLSVWAFELARAGSRRAAVGALLLCGAALWAWDGLILVWGRLPADGVTRFLVQLAPALMVVWVVECTVRLWRKPVTGRVLSVRSWVIAAWSVIILSGIALSRPLLLHLFEVAHNGMPVWPSWPAWLREVLWTPAWPAALILAWGAYKTGRRVHAVSGGQVVDAAASASLTMIGHVRTVIEQGLLEGMIGSAAQAVISVSAWLHRWLEMGGLEGSLRWVAKAVEKSSNWALGLELGGLEGSLRWTAGLVQLMARGAQRLHTGRLRANLVWVVLGLIVMVLTLVFLAG